MWKRRRDSNKVDDDDDDNYGGLSMIIILKANNYPPSFARLSSLSIYHCPKLYSMTLFPYLEELYLGNTNLRPLEQTILMGMISMASSENPTTTTKTIAESISSTRSCSSSSSSSSTLTASFAPLSKLKSLCISLMEGNDGLLLQTIQHLTALEELVLFNYNEDGMELEWQCLRKLQNLRLYDHPKLASLLVGLQQATSLRNLKISNCSSLKTLSKWIYNIISLQSLEIWDCPNLTSLPGLTYLKTLTIWNCPILVERCKSDDWLAHIQNLVGDLARPKEEDSSIEFHYAKK